MPANGNWTKTWTRRCRHGLLVAATLLALSCTGRTYVPSCSSRKSRYGPWTCISRCSAVPAGHADGDADIIELPHGNWRELRASLTANQGSVPASLSEEEGWVHILPAVEAGTLLLAAVGAFALARPELHKALVLVVQHGKHEDSVAVVLNRARPCSQGPGFGGLGGRRWRVAVVDGEGAANDCQTGNAQRLIALRGDGHLPSQCHVLADVVGELSWQAGELQAEVDCGLWVASAIDAVALMSALQSTPQETERKGGGKSGRESWVHMVRRLSLAGSSSIKLGLPQSISTAQTSDSVGDELLDQWVVQHWDNAMVPETTSPLRKNTLFPCHGAAEDALRTLGIGTLILMGADGFATGVQQHLHKAILLVIGADGDRLLAVCINRPLSPPPRSLPSARAVSGVSALSTLRSARSRGSSLSGLGNRSPLQSRAHHPQRRHSDVTSHFGGPDDWDRWTCLLASDDLMAPCPPLGWELQTERVGDSGLWRCHSATDAWNRLRRTALPVSDRVPAHLMARGLVQLGRLELELLERRGQAGIVTHWTTAMRDVVAGCVSYRGPAGNGVRLGLYGDHHGFGLWERAVSHGFHNGDDHAATSVRGAVGDRALREWAAHRCRAFGDLGSPGSTHIQ